METKPSEREAVEHHGVHGCISGTMLWVPVWVQHTPWSPHGTGEQWALLSSCPAVSAVWSNLTLIGSVRDPRLLPLPIGEAGGCTQHPAPCAGLQLCPKTPIRGTAPGCRRHHRRSAVSSTDPQFPVGIGLHKACPVVSLFISPV